MLFTGDSKAMINTAFIKKIIILYIIFLFRQRPPGYPITSGAFSGPYPPSLSSSSFRFGPPGLFHPHHGLHHPGMPHPALMSPGPKQEPQDNHR